MVANGLFRIEREIRRGKKEREKKINNIELPIFS
jgi:hypothetical protein